MLVSVFKCIDNHGIHFGIRFNNNTEIVLFKIQPSYTLVTSLRGINEVLTVRAASGSVTVSTLTHSVTL